MHLRALVRHDDHISTVFLSSTPLPVLSPLCDRLPFPSTHFSHTPPPFACVDHLSVCPTVADRESRSRLDAVRSILMRSKSSASASAAQTPSSGSQRPGVGSDVDADGDGDAVQHSGRESAQGRATPDGTQPRGVADDGDGSTSRPASDGNISPDGWCAHVFFCVQGPETAHSQLHLPVCFSLTLCVCLYALSVRAKKAEAAAISKKLATSVKQVWFSSTQTQTQTQTQTHRYRHRHRHKHTPANIPFDSSSFAEQVKEFYATLNFIEKTRLKRDAMLSGADLGMQPL